MILPKNCSVPHRPSPWGFRNLLRRHHPGPFASNGFAKLPLHAPIQDHFPQDDSFAVYNPAWEEILEKMVHSQVETVFVLNREGQVTGSLSRSDLLRRAFSWCRMMERILEQGSDGWFLVNEEEKMVFANQSLLELMACSGEEWLGKPIGQMLPD